MVSGSCKLVAITYVLTTLKIPYDEVSDDGDKEGEGQCSDTELRARSS